MYLFHPEAGGSPEVTSPPDSSAGLWVCPRNGSKSVKVSIPRDCLGSFFSLSLQLGSSFRRISYNLPQTAFQTGEALQLLTNNRLSATPHFVRAGDSVDVVT